MFIRLIPLWGVVLIALNWPVCHAQTNDSGQSYSRQKIFFLNPGEEFHFETDDRRDNVVRLVSVDEIRDQVVKKVRSAKVGVELNAQPIELRCGPYVMPTVFQGVRIQADTTSGIWNSMPKRVQFSVWDALDPIVDTNQFCFPVKNHEIFSQGMQVFNELSWQGLKSDGYQGAFNYHNYGLDVTGYEGRDEVLSPVSGVILGTWTEITNHWDPGSVVIVGDQGLWWECAHLDSTAPGITKGTRLKKGDRVGWIGTRGPYGKNPNAHVGTYFLTGPKRWNVNRQLNLFPWYITAYQAEYQKNLYSVAGNHHILYESEEGRFDGEDSISFDSKIKSYLWKFSDGDSLDGKVVHKSFKKPGIYSAELWIEDEKGRKDVSFCEIKIYSRSEPKPLSRLVLTAYPSIAKTHEPIYFRGWNQGDIQGMVSIDCGDGTVLTNYTSRSEVSHVYEKPGLYLVTAHTPSNSYPITRQVKVVVKE